jgi:hypothetical protein
MYNHQDDTMDYSVDTDTDISYQQNNITTILNSSSKNFRLVSRKIGRRKKIQCGYFTTSFNPNSKIVNAITGLRYRDEDPKCKYLVGSLEENLLFKVCISNGETGQDPVLLFYDSPEQFEKHQYTALKQIIKEEWLNKKLHYIHSKRLQMKS